MAQDQVPDPGRDGDPARGGAAAWPWPAGVVPGWLSAADRELVRAALAGPDEPPEVGEEEVWYGEAERVLAALPGLDAGAAAEQAEQAALRAARLANGLGDGYGRLRGGPPLPGVHAGPAAGFGQGMCLDEAPPGSVLSLLADEASGEGRGFAGVSDDELLGIMSARRRLVARQAWELLTVIAEFIRRRPAPGCGPEGRARMPRVWSEHACGELAAVLAVTGYEADWLLGLAWDLAVKLPATAAALRDGVIDLAGARAVAAWCAPLTAGEAAAAEAVLFADPGVAEWTGPMLRDRAARAVMQVNPDVTRRRREQGARDRRVEARPELSGNAMLAGRELPPAVVLAASQALTARARELRKLGVPGSMDELRAAAFQESLGVLDPLAGLQAPGGETSGGTDGGNGPGGGSGGDEGGGDGSGPDGSGPDGSGPDGGGDGGGPDGSGGGSPGPRPADPGPGAGTVPGVVPPGFAARVNLTVPLVTLLGLAQRPGLLPGTGPVDPALARDLAAAAARNPATTWCITVTGPDGRPVGHGCGRPPPRGGDHRPGNAEVPPGAAARGGPVWYAPGDGRGPPGCGTVRLDPGALAAAIGAATPRAGGGRDLVFALHRLAGPCDHAHQAAGHDPGRLLRHLTEVLNATCTLPPCRRPASQSDYEHSRPHQRGGRTCLCEAGPVCRRNHRDKQSPGWQVQAGENRGEFRWTTPSGRTYLSRPTQYPD